jgi:hypothetical protein
VSWEHCIWVHQFEISVLLGAPSLSKHLKITEG